jgi:Rps23 Pro-64 3,4-dihydroxylase Tpa1-like proline 4-hydroxylase
MCVTVKRDLCLSHAESFSSPFEYFTSPKALNANLAARILTWLETAASWKLVEANFYEQYEFSLWNTALPFDIEILVSTDFINNLRVQVGELFKTEFGCKVDVTAHKLVQGQRIRLHNDFVPGQETHRLLIQLNRGWKNEDGGLLLLFNSSDPADIHKAFRPIHNTALGFIVSPTSHHAVSTVHGGERFTLVYSFYGNG